MEVAELAEVGARTERSGQACPCLPPHVRRVRCGRAHLRHADQEQQRGLLVIIGAQVAQDARQPAQ